MRQLSVYDTAQSFETLKQLEVDPSTALGENLQFGDAATVDVVI